MVKRFFQQLRVLLWKNYKLKTRRPILFLIELVIPLALCIILGEVRKTKPPTVEKASHYYPAGLPSAGLIPFIQGLPVVGCWDYETQAADYYPLPPWLNELPNIEKAFRRVVAWPLVNNGTSKDVFKDFAVNDLGLNDRESKALTVSSVNLLPMSEDILNFGSKNSSKLDVDPGNLLLYLLNKDMDLIFDMILRSKACKGELGSIMDFPQEKPYKLSEDEIAEINQKLCSMNADQETKFKLFTKPDDQKIKEEAQLLHSLLSTSFYPIPLGASAPVLKIYQRSITLGYRSTRTTLALIKYYFCPTWLGEMESYFINLEESMNIFEASEEDSEPREGDTHQKEDETTIKHLQRRDSGNNANIFNKDKSEVKKSLESNDRDISLIESEIWYTLTHGELFYSPRTPLVESIVKESNKTFQLIGNLIESTNNINSRVKSVMEKTKDGYQAVIINAVIKTLLNYSGIEPPDNVTALLANVSDALSMVSDLPTNFSINRWTGFDTERELELAGVEIEQSEDRWLWAGITFEDLADNITELPANIRYKIRMKSGYMPPLRDTRYLYWRSYPYNFLWDRQYWVYGFMYIQDMVESGISTLISNGTFQFPGFYSQMFPYPCWLNDKYLFIISRTLPMCMVISWVYIVAMSTRRIVYEKELRLKEVMKVMGLSDGVHWWGWGITLLVTTSVTNVFLVLILKYNGITIFTNWFILYLLLQMFTVCNIAVCFLISVFFLQSKLAAVVSAVVFYTMYIPYTIASLQEENMDFWMKMIASLSSTTAFGFGMLQIARYEEQGVGLQWDNFFLPPDNAQVFSLLHVFIIMTVDFLIYIILALYFQQVLPSKHCSANKPWFFPLSWCLNPLLRRLGINRFVARITTDEDTDSLDIEPVAKHLIPGVEIVSLSKHYGGKHSPYALRNLSLKLYRGQVTALLGHNGAGKTTTMSIITGMIGPTSGSFHIRSNAEEEEVNKDSIGVCPQHNILWDDLTIAEHILFYGQLRGMTYQDVTGAMEQFIKEVDLPLEKRDSLVRTLSGGMKRKLSVAIAFLGNTRTLVLDEPTAGVDPKARRDIWDMLIKNKRDRTILLSTHHMEEADILGDRIAILSQGNLVCCGSSLFLKRISGGSYFLTVEITSGTSSETLVRIVSDIFLSVHVQSHSKSQVVMELEASDMELFEKLCYCLDDMKKANEIVSYGICAPTMEDVFLKLSASSRAHCTEWPGQYQAEDGREMRLIDNPTQNGRNQTLDTIHEDSVNINFDETYAADLAGPNETDDTDYHFTYRQMPNSLKNSKSPLVPTHKSGSTYNTGCRLYWQQFRALFMKRWHHAKRDKKGVFAQIVLPALFIAAAMAINLAAPTQSSYNPRVMSFSMFKSPNYIPFEFKTPDKNVTKFNRDILHGGVTYGDSYVKEVRAEREGSFEQSESFPSAVLRGEEKWTLRRDFVPSISECTVNYGIEESENEIPFPTAAFQTKSGDIFTNITGNTLTDYLMLTQPEYKLARYVAFTFDDHRSDIVKEYESLYTAKRSAVKSWYLNKGYHALPTGLNAAKNLHLTNAGSKHHITAAAQAMNETAAQTSHDYITQGVPIVISIFIIVGLSFVPTSFVVYLVAERSSNAKHLQFCAGVRPEIYWISNFVWDICNFMLPTLVSTVLFLGFNQEAFVDDIKAVILIIILYGCATTPMFYPCSFFFRIPSAAYVTLMCFNLFVAVTTSYGVFILERFPDDPTLTMYAHVLDKVFLIFPPYCLGKGFVDLTYNYVMGTIYKSMGIATEGKIIGAWEWNCLGRYILVLPVTSIFWLLFTITVEKYTLRKRRVIRTMEPESASVNEDVHQEYLRARESKDDILAVNGLAKQYTTYSVEWFIDWLRRRSTAKYSQMAVSNITFGVKKGECFGLLGINGAGKTSTFNMLTGAVSVTGGDASVGGQSVVTNLSQVQQLLGYCPQFDALINSLTGREMLTLFAALHGVKDPASSASHYIEQLGIEKYSEMQCCKYSGGNRRKLSAAIALVGNPEVLLLDEPTAGMDPGARRQLWDVIQDAKSVGTSVLLTSHSMGECEVLCDRIGIMCDGRLQCVGSPHYLKERYGSGYSATIKSSHVGFAMERMEEEFVDHKLLEQHHNMVMYSIPHQSKLAPLFAFLSKLRLENVIDDYSVSQCSLEDVFINFARKTDSQPRGNISDLLDEELSFLTRTRNFFNFLS